MGGGTEVRIPVAGLFSNPNDFDDPPGSTEVLDNFTFDRPNIGETRRGFGLLELTPTIDGPITQGTTFRGFQIVHHDTDKISRWTGTAWSTYTGTFAAPDDVPNRRVHFEQMAGSLFATTAAGVYELDAPDGTWRLTGAPKALDSTATLRRTVNETGFATSNGQWAYRVEWGFRNANGRLQIGPPSGRFLVQNPADFTATAANISKPNASTTVTVINTTHGLVTGEYVDVTLGGAETYFAAGTFQVTVLSATSFSYSDALNNGSGVTQNPGADINYGFTNGRAVTLAIPIPDGITVDYFVLVFRSAKSAGATSEPSDQLAQVYERSPTNLEITAGTMTVVDITPDAFRGQLLDTSAETLLASKYQPPECADLAQFHGCAFCAATTWMHQLPLQLFALGGTSGLQVGDFLGFISNPASASGATILFTVSAATAENAALGQFKLFTDGTTSQNIANTAKSLVRIVNERAANTTIYASYESGDLDAPGKMMFTARSPSVDQFVVEVHPPSTLLSAGAFIPTLPQLIGITDMTRVGTTVTVNTASNHGFTSGQAVQLILTTETTNFPNGTKTITVVDPNTFTYTESGPAVGPLGNGGFFSSQPLLESASTQIARTDRLAFSLPDQPWSVPLPYELFVEGNPTKSQVYPLIQAIESTRDRLYVVADSGLFQVTGFFPDFSVTTLQSPLKLLTGETLVSTGTPGRVYGLTEQGEVEVMTSAAVVSTSIQDKFQALQSTTGDALPNYAFSVAYPSDYKVLVFTPTASTDTASQQAFVFFLRDGNWSRWSIAASTGWVDPDSDKLYLGQADGSVWVEKKSRFLGDYADPGSTVLATLDYTTVTTPDADHKRLTTVVDPRNYVAVGAVVRNSFSSTSAIVDAVTATTVDVRITSGFNANGSFDVLGAAYTQTIRWSRWFGKEGPTLDKEVTSGLVLVEKPTTTPEFTSITISAATDYDPAFSTPETLTLNSVMTSQLPFKVPTAQQRGGWFQFEVVHAAALKRLRLLGLSLNYKPAGAKEGY